MSFKLTNDYGDDISIGNVRNKKQFTKFGRSRTTATPSTVNTFLGGTKTYVYPDAADRDQAVTVYLNSTAGDTGQYIKITGHDKNYKEQSEIILTTGSQVATKYKYLRSQRMSIVASDLGALNAADITLTNAAQTEIYAAIDFDTDGDGQGQSEQLNFTVAAGTRVVIDTIVLSSYTADETNIILSVRDNKAAEDYPGKEAAFVTKFNHMVYRNSEIIKLDKPYVFEEFTDVEARSYNAGGTGVANVQLFGYTEILNSVPVAIENLTATGDEQLNVSWTEQTPAETQDLAQFKVSIDGESTAITDVESTGITYDGLVNGQEYAITVQWVGNDGICGDEYSVIGIPTETPTFLSYIGIPYNNDEIAFAAGTIVTGIEDVFTFTTVAGETGNLTAITSIDDLKLALFDSGELYKTGDSVTFTNVASNICTLVYTDCDICLVQDATTFVYSVYDGTTFTPVIGLTSAEDFVASEYPICYSDTYGYYLSDDENSELWNSTDDGITWSAVTGSSAGDSMIIDDDRIIISRRQDEASTYTILYSYTDTGDLLSLIDLGATTIPNTSEDLYIHGTLLDKTGAYVTYAEDEDSGNKYTEYFDGTNWISITTPSIENGFIARFFVDSAGTIRMSILAGDASENLYRSYLCEFNGTGFDEPELIFDFDPVQTLVFDYAG